MILAVCILQVTPRLVLFYPTNTLEQTVAVHSTCHDDICDSFGIFTIGSLLPSQHTGTSGKQRWRPESEKRLNTNQTCWYYGLVLLLLSGDVHINPGPTQRKYKYPCGNCWKPVMKNQKGILCDSCELWFHIKCLPEAISISNNRYELLTSSDESWYCYDCQLPMFTDSFFEKSGDQTNLFNFTDSFFEASYIDDKSPDGNTPNKNCETNQSSDAPEQTGDTGLYKDFINLRAKNPSNFLVAHININSVQFKFEELSILLKNNLVDCLFISETKLNSSHQTALFQVENYKLYRKDNTHDNGGGLMAYIRSDVPSYEEKIETHPCENLAIVTHLQGVKWILCAAYRKPSIPERMLLENLDMVIDKCMNITSNILLSGDLNCNMLKRGNNAVRTLCDDFNLINIITKPTCFKVEPPTLLDVMLVRTDERIKNSEVVPCPLSDFHHFIVATLDIRMPKRGRRQVTYRSFKHFNSDLFNKDLEKAPFHVSYCLDTDDQCHFITTLYKQILEDHAPIKTKTIKTRQCPYMNSSWRRAVFKKHQLYNRFAKCRTRINWNLYRKQRNLCQKLKRDSLKNYLQEKCVNSKSEPRKFWETVKPYFTDKSKEQGALQLIDGNNLVNDPKKVAQLLNDKFSTIAIDIGKDSAYNENHKDHPSYGLIDNLTQTLDVTVFDFKKVDVSDVYKIMKNLNPSKATGYDGIPPKTLKCSSQTMAPVICNVINKMFEQCLFPDPLKKAVVMPIYKAKSRLLWSNYRPISVLTSISKIFETLIAEQMYPHLDRIYSKYLSAYRQDRGCHSVLIHATETWKQALDNKCYVGIVLTDLSKAFDCLPHDLLLEKLRHYNFGENAVNLLKSYLTGRCQKVKIENECSDWVTLQKGVPQGSVVGPHCFNLYINDLLLLLSNHNIVPSNYADDTTITVTGKTKDEVVQKIKHALTILIKWFKDNLMQINVDKFQFLLLCPNREENAIDHFIQVEDITLKSQEGAKLLGVHVDRNLNFNTHVKKKCAMANGKLLALKRLSCYLSEECKITILRSFILSQFMYCAALYHFSGKYFKDKMERILYRGLKFVFNDYCSSFDDLLAKAKIDSIEITREKSIIIEMYKCLNGIGPEYMMDIFNTNSRSSRRGPNFVQPRVRTTNYGLHSLRVEGPRLWNNLKVNTKLSKNITVLRTNLQNYTGLPCKCSQCK